MGPSDATGELTTDELFRQHAGFVARFLMRLGVPSEQLEDALQEVFLVVHRNGGYRPGIAKPTSYLANIAIRAAATHRRRQGATRKRHSDAPVEEMASHGQDPADALRVRQDMRRLQLALERLPEELRTTLLLVEMEGESCVSVAAGLGCPVGTVYWRLHQARKRLQSALQVVDAAHRRSQPRPAPSPKPAELDERPLPARSLMLFALDGFSKSDAARLLQLAREQPIPAAPVDELLARHQQLVRSGAPLPNWASGCVPHSASWLGLLGGLPIAAGVTAGGALLAAALFATGSPPRHEPRATAGARVAEAPPVDAPQHAGEPSEALMPRAAETTPGSATPQGEDGAPVGPNAAETEQDTTPTSTAQRATERATATTAVPMAAPGLSARAAREPAIGAVDPVDTVDHVDHGGARPRGPADIESPAPREAAAAEDARDATRAARPRPEPTPMDDEVGVPDRADRPVPDAALSEMRDVALAERLLSSDPARALAMARTMRTRFPDGYFREERAYVEVMALLELGRTREMREKATAFLRAYPAGLYSGRVRKAVANQGD